MTTGHILRPATSHRPCRSRPANPNPLDSTGLPATGMTSSHDLVQSARVVRHRVKSSITLVVEFSLKPVIFYTSRRPAYAAQMAWQTHTSERLDPEMAPRPSRTTPCVLTRSQVRRARAAHQMHSAPIPNIVSFANYPRSHTPKAAKTRSHCPAGCAGENAQSQSLVYRNQPRVQ